MKQRLVLIAGGALAFALLLTQLPRRDAGAPRPSGPHPQPPSEPPPSSVGTGWKRATGDSPSASLPAPGSSGPTGAAGAPDPGSPDATRPWLEALLAGEADATSLPREALDRWLASGRTNAADLLAARQAGGGGDFLLQALAQFPHDPRVLLAAIVLKDDPQAQRERLDRFKAAAPDNALADYLSARHALQNGNPAQAVADLVAASGKPRFDDYVREAMQNAEELYLQAGKSPAEAKALGASTALLPHLAELRGLTRDLVSLQSQYLAAGDPASAQRLAQMGLQLGERLTRGDGSQTLIGQLVGISVEQTILKSLDPETPYAFLGGTPADALAGLAAQRASVKESTQVFDDWLRSATDVEIMNYFDRMKLSGEAAALKWLQQRRGTP